MTFVLPSFRGLYDNKPKHELIKILKIKLARLTEIVHMTIFPDIINEGMLKSLLYFIMMKLSAIELVMKLRQDRNEDDRLFSY